MAKAMKAMKAMAMKATAAAMKGMKAMKTTKKNTQWRPKNSRLVWGYRMPIAGSWIRLYTPKAMVAAKKPRKAMKAM